MEVLTNIGLGFEVALQPQNLLFCFIGVLLGTLIGVLPGIGPTTGVALLIPITFGLSPTTAIIAMCGLYYGAMYGGSTTSILINVPGESSSVMTCMDGYQMARKGRAGAALGMAAIGSFIAGTFAVIMLMLFAPPIADFALTFGPPEIFALTFMGLTLVTSLAGRSVVKGLMAASVGLLLATVGVDSMSGTSRFTFGNMYMLDGIAFIAVAVGLFAIPEILINVEEETEKVFVKVSLKLKDLLPNKQEWKDSAGPLARGTIFGFMVGALPGAGATVASFLAYAAEKKLNKKGHLLGTGFIAGVASPEAANNSAAGGAMIHLLTLGLPGSGTTAIMMGALIIHGLRPGPLLFHDNPAFVWGLIASMYVSNAMLLILNLPLVGMWVSLLRIPYRVLMPLILVISTVGVFATENSMFMVFTMIVFGVIGYLMRKLDFPAAPMVLALVMGPMVEANLRRAMTMSHGDPSIFFTRPWAAGMMVIALISLSVPLIRALLAYRRTGSGPQMPQQPQPPAAPATPGLAM